MKIQFAILHSGWKKVNEWKKSGWISNRHAGPGPDNQPYKQSDKSYSHARNTIYQCFKERNVAPKSEEAVIIVVKIGTKVVKVVPWMID